ncbi:MAG: hypothetical protein Q8S84_00610 [bacterium]|nr:hypothetical protein [bacterium]
MRVFYSTSSQSRILSFHSVIILSHAFSQLIATKLLSLSIILIILKIAFLFSITYTHA